MSERPPRDESCKGQRWWVLPPGRTEWFEVQILRYDPNPAVYESTHLDLGPRKPLWEVQAQGTHRFIVGISDVSEVQWSKTPPSP